MISLDTWVSNPFAGVMALAQGNVGAVTVATELYKYRQEDARGLLALMHADDMGVYGSQLWVAYKDHCGEDIAKLCERLIAKDKQLLEPRGRTA